MKKCRAVGLYSLLMLLVCCACSWAQVIKQDPNKPKPAVAEPAEKAVEPAAVDERLQQKITYSVVDKRLGAVVEDLSTMSGVSIRCGKDKNDWQVQDIPIVVCVRDIELGKLLKFIAESAHLTLTATTIKGVTLYRIWRGPVIEKMIADYQAGMKAYNLARVNREWDYWQKLGSMSQSDWDSLISKPDKRGDAWDAAVAKEGDDPGLWYESTRLFAQLMASVSPDTKQKIMAGERVVWTVNDLPKPRANQVAAIARNDYLQQMYRNKKFAQDHPGSSPSLPEFTEEDVEKSRIEVWMEQGDVPLLRSRLVTSYVERGSAVDMPGRIMRDGAKDAPPYPTYPRTNYSKELKPAVMFKSKITVKIDKPKNLADLKFRDLLALLSQASGYSVVCEDFMSHNRRYLSWHPLDIFDREISIYDILQGLDNGYLWYVDEDSKLIVGSSGRWYDNHKNLAPASLIRDINTKADGDGLYLDDMLPLLQLTDNQYYAWIQDSNAVPDSVAGFGRIADITPLWLFYTSLSPKDKELAKSETGLSLGKFDPKYISNLLGSTAKYLAGGWRIDLNNDMIDSIEQMAKADVLPHLTMKLVKQEVGRSVCDIEPRLDGGIELNVRDTSATAIPRHRWMMVLQGPEGKREMDRTNNLPIYSYKREMEIWAERRKAAGENVDAASVSPK